MEKKAYSGSNARELTLQLALRYNLSLRLAQSTEAHVTRGKHNPIWSPVRFHQKY
jgi:hypothetical protein